MHPGIPLILIRSFHLFPCFGKTYGVLSILNSVEGFYILCITNNFSLIFSGEIKQYLLYQSVFPNLRFPIRSQIKLPHSTALRNYSTYLNDAERTDDIWRMHINRIDPSFRGAHNSQVDWRRNHLHNPELSFFILWNLREVFHFIESARS